MSLDSLFQEKVVYITLYSCIVIQHVILTGTAPLGSSFRPGAGRAFFRSVFRTAVCTGFLCVVHICHIIHFLAVLINHLLVGPHGMHAVRGAIIGFLGACHAVLGICHTLCGATHYSNFRVGDGITCTIVVQCHINK